MTTPTDAELIELINESAMDYQAYNSKETVAFSSRLFAAADRLAALVEEVDHEYVERLAALSLLGKAESENARLRAALEKYADEENWTRHCQYDLYREWVPEEEHGYDTAQEALKETNDG